MLDPKGLAFTTQLTDRAYRSQDATRVAGSSDNSPGATVYPTYLGPWERTQLAAGALLAGPPRAVVAGPSGAFEPRPAASCSRQPRRPCAHSCERGTRTDPGESQPVGGSPAGEEAAEARVAKYSALAREPGVDALSVKVSSIGSQLQPLAFDDTVRVLSERLSTIYRATLEKAEAERPIVMLDMEAYRHVELTLAVMMQALANPELDRVRAGVVLQAYLPEAADWQRRLLEWAKIREERGGLRAAVAHREGRQPGSRARGECEGGHARCLSSTARSRWMRTTSSCSSAPSSPTRWRRFSWVSRATTSSMCPTHCCLPASTT